jgi:hypothetical protein
MALSLAAVLLLGPWPVVAEPVTDEGREVYLDADSREEVRDAGHRDESREGGPRDARLEVLEAGQRQGSHADAARQEELDAGVREEVE